MNYTYLLAAGLMLASCGGNSTQTQQSGSEAQDGCELSYDPSSTEMGWTAYKTSDKIGVPGTFDNITITGTMQADNPIDVIRKAGFEINTSSVNSSNPDRDGKIARSFFGSMMQGATIAGRIIEIDSSKAVLGIGMNDKYMEIPAEVVIEGNKIGLVADIDVNRWEAQRSLDSLNTVCEDLHKAADGQSILWPNVKIEVSTVLTTTCAD